MTEITYYGHACFTIKAAGKLLLLDPFLTENPVATVKAGEIKPDYILISHAHWDHLGDARDIARASGATVISTAEIAKSFQAEDLAAHAMHIGGSHHFAFGRVKLTAALHGSGISGGNPCGFVITSENKSLYFAGDTGLFGDMQLIGRLTPLDVALLPIGDNYTMGIDDAVIATGMLKPAVVIPYHYNTWPLIKADPQQFKRRISEATDAQTVILAPGETYNL